MHTSIRRGRCRNNFRDSGGDKADSNCSETSTRDRPNQEDPSLIQWKNPIVLSNSQQGSDEFRSRDVYGYGLILPSPSQASVHSLQESVPSFPSFPLFPSFPTLLSISVSSHCLPISLCPSISQASEAQQPGTMATGGAGPTMEADELDLDTMMIGMADEEMGECEGMGMGMGGMAGFEDEDASEYSGYSGQFPGGAEGGYRGVHGYEGMENWRWGGAVDGVGHAMTSTSRPTEGAGPRRATTVVRLQDGRKRRTSLLDSSEADDDALERLESDFLNLDNDDLDPLMFDDADLDFDFAAFAHSLSLGTTAYLPSAPVLQSAPSSAAPSSATAIARNQLHSFRAPFTLPDITEDGPALDSSSRMERDPRYANHHLPFSILHASSSLANSHANSTTTTALFDLAVSTAKNANHMTVAPSSIYTQHHHLLSQTPQSRSTAPIATSAAPRRQTASSSTPLKTIDIKPKRKSSNLHRKSSASTLKEPDFFTSLGFVNMDTTPAPVSSLMPVSVEITNEYEGVESPDTPNPAFPDSMVQVGTDVDADYETVLMTDAGVEDNDFFSNASIEEILKATRDAALAVSGAVVGSSAFVGSSSYMGASMVAASADASGTNVHGMAFDFDMDQATLPLFHSASLSASTGGGTSGMGSLFGGMSLGGVLFPSFSEVQEGISQVGHPLEGAELDSEGPCFAGSVAMEDDCVSAIRDCLACVH
ncbi:hypothetical protein BC830DRAFT_473575 [Chytriomyces sp. MP71]|nr:hypothetical protein BC830DRAFT_473575 [Chytriomyces sp. MP71]